MLLLRTSDKIFLKLIIHNENAVKFYYHFQEWLRFYLDFCSKCQFHTLVIANLAYHHDWAVRRFYGCGLSVFGLHSVMFLASPALDANSHCLGIPLLSTGHGKQSATDVVLSAVEEGHRGHREMIG